MATATWLSCLVLLSRILSARVGALTYDPAIINRTCNYGVRRVPAALFFNGTTDGTFLFPLDEASAAAALYAQPWAACWGPGETVDLKAMLEKRKLPCHYTPSNVDGSIDYYEEHACDTVLKANCYCYALGRNVGSYCSPGFGATGRNLPTPISNCSAAVAGLILDGGVPVDRSAVYTEAHDADSHYVALAVLPASLAELQYGDFHFWRLDADGLWSYKAGETMARHTLRDGTPVTDVESPDARGLYTEWCGYFRVKPATHKLVGTQYWYSLLPARVELWTLHGLQPDIVQQPSMSLGWMANYRSVFWDSGWENLPDATAGGGKARLDGSSRGAGEGVPHWVSAVPPGSVARRAAEEPQKSFA